MANNQVSNTNLFNRYSEWMQKHEEAQQTSAATLNKLSDMQIQNDSLFQDAKTQSEQEKLNSQLKQINNIEIQAQLSQSMKEKEIGLQFDFMDGKDATNSKDYNEQLSALSQANIDLYDTKDKNGTLNYDEYFAFETQNSTQDEIERYKDLVQENFNFIDADGNGEIDLQEMNTYYEFIDEQDGEKDGKFTMKSAFGEVKVTIDKWNSNEKNNIDCASRIIYNIFGVSLCSEDGKEYLSQLQEINPNIDFNNLQPGQEVQLIRMN